MYLFVPCDKKSHGTEISFPIRSNRLSHPHPPEKRAVSWRSHMIAQYGCAHDECSAEFHITETEMSSPIDRNNPSTKSAVSGSHFYDIVIYPTPQCNPLFSLDITKKIFCCTPY